MTSQKLFDEIYFCRFCGTAWAKTKSAIITHEKYCDRKPVNLKIIFFNPRSKHK